MMEWLSFITLVKFLPSFSITLLKIYFLPSCRNSRFQVTLFLKMNKDKENIFHNKKVAWTYFVKWPDLEGNIKIMIAIIFT